MFSLKFHPEAVAEIKALNQPLQAQVTKALMRLEAEGNRLRMPHTKPIQGEVFELRAGGKNITRSFLLMPKGKKFSF